MTISSPSFKHNDSIPSKYTCDGENVNPSLEIQNVSQNAKSLALIMDDPDAPAGTWVHWTVWNIDPEIGVISEDQVPDSAIQGITSFDAVGYGGPCPHTGTHRYVFKLYALDAMLELSAGADKTALEKAMEGHVLEKTELIGLYKKQ